MHEDWDGGVEIVRAALNAIEGDAASYGAGLARENALLRLQLAAARAGARMAEADANVAHLDLRMAS